MNKDKFIALFLAGQITLVACDGENTTNTQETDSTEVQQEEKIPALTWQMEKLEEKAGDCGEGEERCLVMLASYPIFTGDDQQFVDDLNKKINRYVTSQFTFEDSGNDLSLKDAMQSMITDFEESTAETQVGWNLDVSVVPQLVKGKYLTLAYNVSGYTGGAHGNSNSQYENWEMVSKRKLRLEDIVSDVYALTAMGEKQFREYHQLKADDSLEDAGFWFEKNRFSLSDNFLLSEKAIFFLYNTYEVAPYAAGDTEISIPWKDLEQIVNEEFKSFL